MSAATRRDPREIALQVNSIVVHLNRRLRRLDEGIGLPPAQASALALLSSAGPHAISDVAQFERVSAPTMTRIIAALESRGLVQRARDGQDQRRVVVAASAEGKRLISTALRARATQLAAAIDALSAEDRDTLGKALPVLAALAGIPDPGGVGAQ